MANGVASVSLLVFPVTAHTIKVGSTEYQHSSLSQDAGDGHVLDGSPAAGGSRGRCGRRDPRAGRPAVLRLLALDSHTARAPGRHRLDRPQAPRRGAQATDPG